MDGNLSDEALLGIYRQPAAVRPPSGPVVVAPVSPAADEDLLKLYQGTPEAAPSIDTSGIQGAMAAYAGAHARDLPVVGPAVYSGLEQTAAKARSAIHGTKFEDELAAIRAYQKAAEEQHPVTATAGGLSGAVLPMVSGVGMAPRLMGAAGTLGERVVAGGVSNALISGADTAARGGDASQVGQSAAIGGGLGSSLPLAGKVLGAAGNKLFGSSNAETNALAAKAEALGIPIRFAQTSDNPMIAKVAQTAMRVPGSGGGALLGEQQAAFNRAVSNTFGEDASTITPDVMKAAKTRLGKVYDEVGKYDVNLDPQLNRDLQNITQGAKKGTKEEADVIAGHINDVLDKTIPGGGKMTGEEWQALTQTGSPLDIATGSERTHISRYTSQIKDALDRAMERSLPPDVSDRFKEANRQYKNMKTIEDLVATSPTGDIKPLNLMNKVKNSYDGMAYGGGGKLADLAYIGQRFMRQPADSGTPMGMVANALLGLGGAGLGAGYGGITSGWDPMTTAKDAMVIPLLARGTTTLLNRPQAVNRLLQRLPAGSPALNQLLLAPSAQRQ